VPERKVVKYPFIVKKEGKTYGAVAAQFMALATATSKKDVLERAAKVLAVYLFEEQVVGRKPPKPLPHNKIDVSDFIGTHYELVDVEPLPTNPRSLEVARLIETSGLTQREIARRMGTTQSAVSRMTDPFYWNHSLSSLDRFAKAMGKTIDLRYLEAA
jgi:antitoxin HicB